MIAKAKGSVVEANNTSDLDLYQAAYAGNVKLSDKAPGIVKRYVTSSSPLIESFHAQINRSTYPN
jgi:hypothetical protein